MWKTVYFDITENNDFDNLHFWDKFEQYFFDKNIEYSNSFFVAIKSLL